MKGDALIDILPKLYRLSDPIIEGMKGGHGVWVDSDDLRLMIEEIHRLQRSNKWLEQYKDISSKEMPKEMVTINAKVEELTHLLRKYQT